jgi:hypothetical protein
VQAFFHVTVFNIILLYLTSNFIGQFDLTISNAWSGTKVIMNQELQEIKDFIQRQDLLAN